MSSMSSSNLLASMFNDLNVGDVSSTDLGLVSSVCSDTNGLQVEVVRPEQRIRFDESNEVSVVRHFGQGQNPDASFEINASMFAAFPSLLSSSSSFTALSSACSDLDAFDFFTSHTFSTAASTDDGDESLRLDASILDILPSLIPSPSSFDSFVGDVSNAWEDSMPLPVVRNAEACAKPEKKLRFAELVDVLVYEEYEGEKDPDYSFELDASVLATFPSESLLSPSSSFDDLSLDSFDFDYLHSEDANAMQSELQIPRTKAAEAEQRLRFAELMDVLVVQDHDYEYEFSVELDASVLATIPSLISSSFSLDGLNTVDSDPDDQSFELDASVLATFPSLLSSSLEDLSSDSSDFDSLYCEDANPTQPELMDTSVFHECKYESSVELDASVLVTIPFLLSSSASFDGLSSESVCYDSDSFHDIPSFKSISSKSIDIDGAIVDAFPSLLSPSCSFELNVGNVSDVWELETNVTQLQPEIARNKVARTTRPKKRLRFADFVDVRVFQSEPEQEQEQDPDVYFELNASSFAIFPSLLSSSDSFTALSSCCADFDMYHGDRSSTFACTVTLVE